VTYGAAFIHYLLPQGYATKTPCGVVVEEYHVSFSSRLGRVTCPRCRKSLTSTSHRDRPYADMPEEEMLSAWAKYAALFGFNTRIFKADDAKGYPARITVRSPKDGNRRFEVKVIAWQTRHMLTLVFHQKLSNLMEA